MACCHPRDPQLCGPYLAQGWFDPLSCGMRYVGTRRGSWAARQQFLRQVQPRSRRWMPRGKTNWPPVNCGRRYAAEASLGKNLNRWTWSSLWTGLFSISQPILHRVVNSVMLLCLASQDALEVMGVSHWKKSGGPLNNLYSRLDWCNSGDDDTY